MRIAPQTLLIPGRRIGTAQLVSLKLRGDLTAHALDVGSDEKASMINSLQMEKLGKKTVNGQLFCCSNSACSVGDGHGKDGAAPRIQLHRPEASYPKAVH
jgi:hypothetical protein